MKLYTANIGLTKSSLEALCTDILGLERAKGLCQAFAQDQMGGASRQTVSCEANEPNRLLVQRHLGSQSYPGKSSLSNLELLLTIRVSNEMIANLRSRLGATCHEVTGLWLTDIGEARNAMRQKLGGLPEIEELMWLSSWLWK